MKEDVSGVLQEWKWKTGKRTREKAVHDGFVERVGGMVENFARSVESLCRNATERRIDLKKGIV